MAALQLAVDVEGGSRFTMRLGWLLDLVRRVLPIADAAPATLRATTTAILAWDTRDRGHLKESLTLCDRSLQLLGNSDDPIARCAVLAVVAACRADVSDGVLDQRTVADAVAASDRAGGTFWPFITRYSICLRTPPSTAEPLISGALRLAQHHSLDYFADALARGTLAVGTQFRADSEAVLDTWRQLIPRLDDRGLCQDNNVCFYALGEGEHADILAGLHLAEHFLTRLRTHRFDPSFEASLRWVIAHLARLHGDIERSAQNVALADRLAPPGFNFLGGLADITRSALG